LHAQDHKNDCDKSNQDEEIADVFKRINKLADYLVKRLPLAEKL
jgi:hypothetical protein